MAFGAKSAQAASIARRSGPSQAAVHRWRIGPGDLEAHTRIVDELLEVGDKGALVRIRQQPAIEAHLGLLGNDVDL